MKRKGPIQNIREGSTSIPIYRSTTRTGDTFVAAWYEGSDRKRKAFANLSEAVEFSRKRARELARLGTTTLTLSGKEMLAYSRAKSAIEPLGIDVDTAIIEYVEAKKLLGAPSLVTAIQDYLRLCPANLKAPPVRQVVEEFLAAKSAAGRSEAHLHDLTWRLKQFSSAFSVPVSDIRVADVERWLSSLKVKGRTKNNSLASVTSLIRFAERRGYVTRGLIDLSQIDRSRDTGEIGVFTPEELRALLRSARPEMVPYLAVCAYAGLRSAEASRLDWSEIHDDHIDVKAAKSKTRQRRLAPMLPVLAQTLRPYRQASGPIASFATIENQIKLVAKTAQVTWKRNGLRHSFGTYRMAILQNEQRVALEMGNTPGMVFAHYRAIATKETAEAWFEVTPSL
jgi:integrase